MTTIKRTLLGNRVISHLHLGETNNAASLADTERQVHLDVGLVLDGDREGSLDPDIGRTGVELDRELPSAQGDIGGILSEKRR